MSRKRLGPLSLESKLGDYPSRSTVWRAVHPEHRKPLAVKVFQIPFGGTEEAQDRFTEEYEELKKLRHPAIARCFGGGIEGRQAFLAWELIEGETLAHLLERRGRLPWEAVLDLAIPIAQGLVVAHARGFAHGAIGPDKILISGLAPVLVDFRIDRARSFFRNPRPLSPLEVALQPPEAVACPTAISAQGDLYSLGAVMFLALTGRPPISGETVDEVIARVASEVPPKAASIAMDCPVWVSSLIEQTLKKDPRDRPRDAHALELQLIDARQRSGSLGGVTEQLAGGFSPLQAGQRQSQKDEARALLGRDVVRLDDTAHEVTAFYERAWFLVIALLVTLAGIAWILWPLNENQLRERAEKLIAEQTGASLHQAKQGYLQPMLKRFPEGQHVTWANGQLDEIEMHETEHAIEVKLKRGLPLTEEGERLYAEALRFENFGDRATALDKYKSIERLLSGDARYKPYVGLARRQIRRISGQAGAVGEAARIVNAKLSEADKLLDQGNQIAAREIWYGIIELYSDRTDVIPLVQIAQQRLASEGGELKSRDRADVEP